MNSNAERVPPVSLSRPQTSAMDLGRSQGVTPIASADELALPGVFEQDSEYDDFIADLYESRQASVA
jgi:hypothetical protein